MNNKIKAVLFIAAASFGYASAVNAGWASNCDREMSVCIEEQTPEWVCKRAYDRCKDNR